MLSRVLTQGKWHCLCSDQHREWVLAGVQGVGGIEAAVRQCHALSTTLKDNHRSTVTRGELWGREVVAKRPRDKNRRLWMRLSSLLVASEAVATIANLTKLSQAGVESVEPLFAIERRVFGMVVDSWLCYDYREGQRCDQASLPDIVGLLHQMHSAGFRHGDPTWNNFLKGDDGVLFTIDTKAKPCVGEYHKTHDFALLQRDYLLQNAESENENSAVMQDLATFGSLNRSRIGYRLALAYLSIKTARSWLKSKIKKNRPKNINP